MRDSRSIAAWITYGALLLASLLLLIAVIYPLREPLFLAAVLAGTLWRWRAWLVIRLKGRRNLAAALLTAGVVLLILVPLSALFAYAIKQAVDATRFVRDTLQAGGIAELTGRLPVSLRGWAQRGLELLPESLDELAASAGSGRMAAQAFGGALRITSALAFNAVILLLTLFGLLVEGDRLVEWIGDISPLRGGQTAELIGEFRRTSQSVIGSTLLTGGVQAAVATGGFFIGRVPNALFFGLLTFFAAFVPAIGTAMVGLPVAALMALLGHPWIGLFLALWTLLIVGLIDNLLKPLLMRGGMKVSGLVVLMVLIGGIAIFGPSGFIAGPLAVTFLLSMVRLGKRDFDPSRSANVMRAPPP